MMLMTEACVRTARLSGNSVMLFGKEWNSDD